MIVLFFSINSVSGSHLLSGWLLGFLGGASEVLHYPAVGYTFPTLYLPTPSPHPRHALPRPPHLDNSQPCPLSTVFPRCQAMSYLDICHAVSLAPKAMYSFCPLSKQLLIRQDPLQDSLYTVKSPPSPTIQSRLRPPMSHFDALHKGIYHFHCSYYNPCLWHLSASGEQSNSN